MHELSNWPLSYGKVFFMSQLPKERMREYMAARRARIKEELIVLLGGKCARCGITEDLEFDHIDRATKTFVITSGLDQPRERLLAELAKCQLLCRMHHKEKTSAEPNPNRARGERSGQAKLTEADVRAIRASSLLGRQLAHQYGISLGQIYKIRSGGYWSHVK